TPQLVNKIKSDSFAAQRRRRLFSKVMMPSHDPDGSRLRPFLALFFHEPQFRADCQFLERFIDEAVGMEGGVLASVPASRPVPTGAALASLAIRHRNALCH
ncbi:MAG: hypothetical protein WD845_11900, partial [Pirellulales bacterium]